MPVALAGVGPGGSTRPPLNRRIASHPGAAIHFIGWLLVLVYVSWLTRDV